MLDKQTRLKHYENVLSNYKREQKRRSSFIFRLFLKKVEYAIYPEYYNGLCHALLREYRQVDKFKFLSLKEVLDIYTELKDLSIKWNVYSMCGYFFHRNDLKSRIHILEETIKRMKK